MQQASLELPRGPDPQTRQDEPFPLKTANVMSDDLAPPADSVPKLSPEYAELRQFVMDKHLLDKQPVYYTFKILLNLGLLGLGGTMLVLLKDSWFQLLNAAFMGFVFTQMGFIVHDAGHQQIARSGWKNDLIGILHANLLLGFSYLRWVIPHNEHHAKPNQLGADPDLSFEVFAFTAEQASQKRGLLLWIAKYQAYFFFPFLFLEAVNLKANHIRFLLRSQSKYRAPELVCLGLHLALYFGLLFHYLSFGHALAFIAVHQAIFGLYLGLVISPNHFGMPVLDENPNIDFLTQQVLTARNVRRHYLSDYCYGPLRCQVEHHLFPNMPLNRLREAQNIVQPYCEAHGIPYHETGVIESYREILHYLHEVGAALRQDALRDV
jgi:fatty acid desaturase